MYDTTKLGKVDGEPHWSPPLGIAYIAAVLSEKGYNVKASDFYYMDFDKAKDVVRCDLGKIVGISCFSEQRVTALRMAEYIHSLSPETFIVFGGMHGHYLYEQILREYPIDAIVIGEGEQTFLEVTSRVLSGNSVEDIPGLAVRKDGRVILTGYRRLIQDLDRLPFPRYDDFIDATYAIEEQYRNLKMSGGTVNDARVAGVMASRGCPYHCTFCSTPSFWQRKVRKRSPTNVVDEIELLSKEYGYQFFNFHDDNFIVDRNWVKSICKEIVRRRLSILWSCAARIGSITDDVAKWMKRSGAFLINFGMESYSQLVLDGIGKKVIADQAWESFIICRKNKIAMAPYLLIGSRDESDETIAETVDFLRASEPYSIGPSILTIFPGSAIYDEAKWDGFITDNYWLSDQPCPYDTRFHSLEKLLMWYWTIEECCQEKQLAELI